MKKTYIFDTNVLLTDSDSIFQYGQNDILIPLKVLEELDKHKTRQDNVGSNARRTIRNLDDLRKKGSLFKGIRISKGLGILTVKKSVPSLIPKDFLDNHPDNEILSVALQEINQNNDTKRKIIIVSLDINMRVKADSLNIFSEDYSAEHALENRDYLYSGLSTILVDDEIVDQFYAGKEIFLDKKHIDSHPLYPNQFVMMVSNKNEKKTSLARFSELKKPLKKVSEHKLTWGIKTKNKEQTFALDLLMDPEISLVSLIGTPGSGKTLISLASGLQQLECMKTPHSRYKSLIISRPIQPMGKDIGFLPGSIDEKLAPWVKPIEDNLKFLMGDQTMLEEYTRNKIIEIEALTYIRGRSLPNAFIILDEAQNLTIHEIKTVITRAGEGSKIVLTGDIEQIDNMFVNEITNGLTHVVEKFKDEDISGHITLVKGERSKLATLAAKKLK